MANGKTKITNINVKQPIIGQKEREKIFNDITVKDTYLPKGVLEEDMDKSFINFVGDDDGLGITLDGEKIPVLFLTIQKWAEFTKTWDFKDNNKNIKIPFITIVRKPDIQQGQNQAGLWNIPMNQNYTYLKIPSFDGIRNGVNIYKIPQPVSVDLTYEVRIFANKLTHLNIFNRKIQKAFQSKQCYIKVNGHPIPLILETIGDESNTADFEDRRFYVQLFEIKLVGYIQDENDFEIMPSINRSIMAVESIGGDLIKPKLKTKKLNNNIIYEFFFNTNSHNYFNFISSNNYTFNQILDEKNLESFEISVNGIIQTLPFIVNNGDNILININRVNNNKQTSFKLISYVN